MTPDEYKKLMEKLESINGKILWGVLLLMLQAAIYAILITAK